MLKFMTLNFKWREITKLSWTDHIVSSQDLRNVQGILHLILSIRKINKCLWITWKQSSRFLLFFTLGFTSNFCYSLCLFHVCVHCPVHLQHGHMVELLHSFIFSRYRLQIPVDSFSEHIRGNFHFVLPARYWLLVSFFYTYYCTGGHSLPIISYV